MSSYEVIKEFLESEEFKKLYSDYLKKRDNHLVEFLDNIDLNKKKTFQLFSYLNSDLFQSLNYENINLTTTTATSLDSKTFSVTINANIKDLRPEAFLESENIEIGLKESEIITDGSITTGRYLRDSLPIRISFKL